jgi:LytS/YehU family sensor histidine kinase
MVPLVNEVDFIRNYVSAEELRYGEKVRVNLEVQGLTSLMIEPLLLFPFVENAFKHGAAAEQLSGFIDITIVQIAHELTFVVRNSRSGLKKTGGIGLLNAKKRLELLYPGAYRLEIKQEPISWTVELCIKLPE